MSEYIGNRIVPRHDGVWDSTKAYEPLIIVYEEGSGDSYISRKDVPAGTGLNQKEYWALCARFSEQVALLREETVLENFTSGFQLAWGMVRELEERGLYSFDLYRNRSVSTGNPHSGRAEKPH